MAGNDASHTMLVFRPPGNDLPGHPQRLSGWRHIRHHVTTPPGIRQPGEVTARHQRRSDRSGHEAREQRYRDAALPHQPAGHDARADVGRELGCVYLVEQVCLTIHSWPYGRFRNLK
jgi:hypothetical protein